MTAIYVDAWWWIKCVSPPSWVNFSLCGFSAEAAQHTVNRSGVIRTHRTPSECSTSPLFTPDASSSRPPPHQHLEDTHIHTHTQTHTSRHTQCVGMLMWSWNPTTTVVGNILIAASSQWVFSQPKSNELWLKCALADWLVHSSGRRDVFYTLGTLS